MLTNEQLAATRQEAERVAARGGDMRFNADEIVEMLDAIDTARNELSQRTAERDYRTAENAELAATIEQLEADARKHRP